MFTFAAQVVIFLPFHAQSYKEHHIEILIVIQFRSLKKC